MNMNDMTSKQISDKLAENGIKMHFNSNRLKLEEALNNILTSNEGTNMEATLTETSKAIILPIGATHTADGIELPRDPLHEAQKLIRVIVRPNDPIKRDNSGEIFTVINTSLNNGKAFKKYVPFNNEEGWHVPNIILNMIKSAEVNIFKSARRNGQDVMETQTIKAYMVEVLPALTQEELDTLSSTQKAHNSIG